MYFDFSKAAKDHKIYYLGKYTAKMLSYATYRKLTVKGTENIPKDGPLIIACNHIAFSDPAIIIANCPRTVHFMAKSDLFENRLKALFMSQMNAFPVRRNHFDRASLRYAKSILDRGETLGIFPEGRRVRSSPPTDPKNGVAYLAKITGADVIPACIYRNLDDISAWHSLVLSYGRVIRNSDFGFSSKNRGRNLEDASVLIMEKIKELWETENECYGS